MGAHIIYTYAQVDTDTQTHTHRLCAGSEVSYAWTGTLLLCMLSDSTRPCSDPHTHSPSSQWAAYSVVTGIIKQPYPNPIPKVSAVPSATHRPTQPAPSSLPLLRWHQFPSRQVFLERSWHCLPLPAWSVPSPLRSGWTLCQCVNVALSLDPPAIGLSFTYRFNRQWSGSLAPYPLSPWIPFSYLLLSWHILCFQPLFLQLVHWARPNPRALHLLYPLLGPPSFQRAAGLPLGSRSLWNAPPPLPTKGLSSFLGFAFCPCHFISIPPVYSSDFAYVFGQIRRL